MTGPAGAPSERPASYRAVFGVREFRFLFTGHLLSLIGDQLVRVALAILVYDSTDSAFLAAVTFGISYAPWVLGGPLLSTFADRMRRRSVLVGSDLIRGVVVACLALPGIPLWLMLALLFATSLLAPPFESARSALMPDVLAGDRYAVGTSVTNIGIQIAQVLGFLAGGALVLAISPRGALLINAATFLLSAALVRFGVDDRPAASVVPGAPTSVLRQTADGLRLLIRNRALLRIVALLWLGQLFVTAPEGIAAPFAAQFGHGALEVGLFLAANPLGMVLGAVVIGRLCPPTLRARLTYPLAMLSVLALIPAGLTGNFVVVLVLLVVSGFGASYLIPLNVSFVRAVPSAYRGRAFGVAVSGLYACQGVATVVAGSLAEQIPATAVVTWSGALGVLALAALGVVSVRGRSGKPAIDLIGDAFGSPADPLPPHEGQTSGTIE